MRRCPVVINWLGGASGPDETKVKDGTSGANKTKYCRNYKPSNLVNFDSVGKTPRQGKNHSSSDGCTEINKKQYRRILAKIGLYGICHIHLGVNRS